MPTAPPQRNTSRAPLTAATADRHVLYQLAVQNVEAEIDFVDATFKSLRGRRAVRLREDFCGTANTCCEWVRRRPANVAVGLDLDRPTLDWGIAHNAATLTPAQRARLRVLNRDVLDPGPEAMRMDAVLAMNFSHWTFKERATLLGYFRAVHKSLARTGVFFLDHYGGWESMKLVRERRPLRRFTYIWDQAGYNPITGDLVCHIHFRFPDGTRMKNAFTYDWRLWTLPEVRDLLAEAGFARATVHWEGDDGKGGGNGIFKPSEVGDPCESFIAYVVAER